MTGSLGIFDIGSNTVLLTAGRMRPGSKANEKAYDNLEVLLELHDVARLADGLKDGGSLHPQARERVLKILANFQQQAKAVGIQELRAAGTAAFRRASDGQDFAQEIEKKLGISTQILSGEAEAHYSFQSAKLAFPKYSDSLGMIDIGGGSTEVVCFTEKNSVSLPMGTVSLSDALITSHPILDGEWETLQKHTQEILKKGLTQLAVFSKHWPKHWVALAATPPALASVIQQLPTYDLKKIQGFPMTETQLAQTIEHLRKLNLAAREKIPGMPPKRAELLPIGGFILLELMRFLKTTEIIVSHQGLRYALLLEGLELNNRINDCN